MQPFMILTNNTKIIKGLFLFIARLFPEIFNAL